jgi:hypothetical protein
LPVADRLAAILANDAQDLRAPRPGHSLCPHRHHAASPPGRNKKSRKDIRAPARRRRD